MAVIGAQSIPYTASSPIAVALTATQTRWYDIVHLSWHKMHNNTMLNLILEMWCTGCYLAWLMLNTQPASSTSETLWWPSWRWCSRHPNSWSSIWRRPALVGLIRQTENSAKKLTAHFSLEKLVSAQFPSLLQSFRAVPSHTTSCCNDFPTCGCTE